MSQDPQVRLGQDPEIRASQDSEIRISQDPEVRTVPFQQGPFKEFWKRFVLVIKGPGDEDFVENRDKNSIWKILVPLLGVFASLVGMLVGLFPGYLLLASTPERLVRAPAVVFGALATIYLGVIYYKYVTPIHHLVVGTIARRLGGWTVFLPLLSLIGLGNIRNHRLATPALVVLTLIFTFFLAFLFSVVLRHNVKRRLLDLPEGMQKELNTMEEVLNGWVLINLFTFLTLACVLVPFPYEWTVAAVKDEASGRFWHDAFVVAPLRIEWIIFLLVVLSRAGGAIRSITFNFSDSYWKEVKNFNARLYPRRDLDRS